MSLAKVLEEMKQIRPIADEDLDAIDMNDPRNHSLLSTIGTRRGRKARAQEELKMLRQEYSDLLLKGALFIIAVGTKSAEFNEMAENEGNCLRAGAEDLFEELATRVHPDLYTNKSSTSNLFDVVGRHLEDKANELGISEYPQLIMNDRLSRHVTDKADFVQLLKQALVQQVGGELVGINAIRSITDKAIAANHKAAITPVVLTTTDEAFALMLMPDLRRLTPNAYLVVAGESDVSQLPGVINVAEVNAKSVKAALKQIKNNLK